MTPHDLLARTQSWPALAPAELEQVVLEIEAELRGDAYSPSEAELKGIDRGLRDAAKGRFVSESDIDAIFAKHRRD